MTSEIRLSFVAAQGLVSKIIEWYGHSGRRNGWSHVDMVLLDGRLLGARSDRVGGQPSGVWIRPDNYEAWDRRAIIGLPCDAEVADSVYAWAKTQIGKPYDRSVAWRFLTGSGSSNDDAWYCSELACAALDGRYWVPRLPIWRRLIDPDDLWLLCASAMQIRFMA